MIIKKRLVELKPYKPGKPIEELRRELKVDTIYKLASNENPFPPLYIKKAVIDELANINRYPEGGCFYLRRILSDKLRVKENQIIFGNGSDEIITMAIRAFAHRRGNIVISFPTFLVYEIQAKVSGLNVRKVPLKNYCCDLDAIARRIDKNTDIIFIANPDNPHGTYIVHDKIVKFLSRIPNNVLVFMDEAYYEFAPKKYFPRGIALIKKRGNIIVTRTFSKAYGLAGLRIGYGITTPLISEILNKVREPFNVNRFAQAAAVAALKDSNFMEKSISYINKEKEFFYRTFDNMGIEYVKSATNFILVNFKQDTEKLYHYLLKKGVIIRDPTRWGLDGFFRVTVGLHKENIFFIKSFKEYLSAKH